MNEQQNQGSQKKSWLSTGAAIALGISGIIITFIIVAGVILLRGASFIETIDNIDINVHPDESSEKGAFTWKLITRDSYSFQAPTTWPESLLDFEGCQWDGVANDSSDGHRMAGEIGIYPMNCFNLSNANGYKEKAEVSGYYILAFYDEGTTLEETKETREVFNRIVETFTVK